MRTFWLTALVVCSLLAATSRARAADDTPLQVVEKALKAHGLDPAQAAKFKAGTSKAKGTVQVMGMEIEFTGEISVQGPEQQRIALNFEAGGQKFDFVQVLNGDKGW